MLNLACADAERQCAEPAVAAGMAIAANYGRAGERKALLRPDDMDDTLFAVTRADVAYAECRSIGLKRCELLRAFHVNDWDFPARAVKPRGGRQVVIGDSQGQIGTANRAPGNAQGLESLRAGYFVNKVAINVDQAGAIVAALNQVSVPDFLIKCARSDGHNA